MKIITDNASINAVVRSAARDAKAEAGKFDAMLRDAVQENKTSSTSSTHNLSAMSGATPVDTAMLLNLDTTKIIDGAEGLVDSLQEFQTKLADTSVSLEDISPIVEKMDREKELLMPSLEALSETDPLKGVLNNVLIAATVETEKFKRGDYL
jgi:hypothetical protein